MTSTQSLSVFNSTFISDIWIPWIERTGIPLAFIWKMYKAYTGLCKGLCSCPVCKKDKGRKFVVKSFQCCLFWISPRMNYICNNVWYIHRGGGGGFVEEQYTLGLLLFFTILKNTLITCSHWVVSINISLKSHSSFPISI